MGQNNSVTSKYYSGQGIVLIAKLGTDGKPLGFRNVGNVTDLGISVKTNTIEHKETSSGVRGIDLRLTTEINCTVKMGLENFNKENFALALRGDSAAIAGATVTDEKITVYPGATTPLANINVTTFTSLIEDKLTSPKTYVAGTDYLVNEAVGSITIPEGSSITLATAVLATYAFGGYDNVEALTNAAENVAVRFEGLNTADGNNPCVVEIFKFQADPLKELALINDKIGELQLEGNALADMSRPAGTSYYFREMLV